MVVVDEEVVYWLHVVSSFLVCLEMITVLLLSISKIDDCHTAHVKKEFGKELGA